MEENVVGVTIALARQDFGLVWLLIFNSSLAYFVNLTNFLVMKHTSALTLQVLGNARGAVAIVVTILIFRNPVSVTGMAGYTLMVIGVVLYAEYNHAHSQPSSLPPPSSAKTEKEAHNHNSLSTKGSKDNASSNAKGTSNKHNKATEVFPTHVVPKIFAILLTTITFRRCIGFFVPSKTP
ncbi:hypothetical protein CTI12_AA118420 [Artemisia annua]|uniref:Sugar phosphate transporter domain-containing protein n=1 Tax=Artemisia annua TaxID=35608 RepID=A0A2U1PSN9_ARTAN|nr:hypothetical protein CTI12_AA118420 [Artemisia annua]